MQELTKFHNIIIENRNKIVISGVRDIESFNENEIILLTHSGGLKLKGRGFEIGKVSTDSGEAEMTGEVVSVHYSNAERTPNNIITKIFR